MALSGSKRADRHLAIGLILGFTLAHFLILTARAPLLGSSMPLDLTTMAAKRALLMLFVGSLCYGIYSILVLVRERAAPVRFAAATGLCVVAAALSECFNEFLFYPGWPWRPGSVEAEPLFSGTLYWLWFVVGWTCAYLAGSYSLEVADRERRLADANALAQEAHLRALRYQVNPHFLFNTLNSVASLVSEGERRRAERMVLTLADFFRTSLASDPLADVRLEDEFLLQGSVLDIERMRFGDRLQVTMHLPPGLKDAMIPSMLLQPLVENTIKHAVARSETSIEVAMEARAVSDRLVITVENDMPAIAGRSAGVGIGHVNVRDRLMARWGEEATFEAGPDRGRFTARLTLPLRRVT